VLKLFYFKSADGVPNFGDDLNPWLWGNLLAGYLNDESDTLFVGIGTLLNDRLPRARRTIVFGSGVGFGSDRPRVDNSWTFCCVRGPLSADALGLDASAAVTDSALLIASLVSKRDETHTHDYAYMPHYRNANDHWKAVCRRLGFGYIDPRDSRERVIAGMKGSRVLIAEAMHGAIVADALGIPWIPVKTTGAGVLDFKWRDWCGSLNLTYMPQTVVPLYSSTQGIKLAVKSSIAAAQLFRISRRVAPQLSDERLRLTRLTELQERLERLKQQLRQERG
jgi:succinoglycan biosynthesis protein ExoV